MPRQVEGRSGTGPSIQEGLPVLMLESGGSGIGPTDKRSGNGQRGPAEWDIRGTGYIADIFNKDPYKRDQDYLANQGELLVVKANLWAPEVARGRIRAIMAMVDPDNTSWIGFRKKGTPQGEYSGFAWQTELSIPVPGGSMRLLWMFIRAFEPEAQAKHLGRAAMSISLVSHPDATDIGHRTGSAAAIRSWLMAPIFSPNSRAPFEVYFHEVPRYKIALPVIYELTHINGQPPDPRTGVSIGEYTEANRAFIPKPNHRPTMEILEWMKAPVDREVIVLGKRRAGLGMDLPGGDALFEMGALG